MALSIGAVGSLGNAKTGTTFNVGVPAGVASGTLVCIAVMAYNAGSAPTTPTITGFTLSRQSAASMNAFGFQFRTWWFYKYATAADTGSYAIGKASTNAMMAYAFTVSGWTSAGDPFADTLHESVTDGGATTVASFTPGGNNSLLALIMLDSGANYPPTWTKNVNTTDLDGDTITLASITQTTAAATGAQTVGNADGTIASVATLRQATSMPAPEAAYNFDEGSGTVAHDSSGHSRNATVSAFGTGHTLTGTQGSSSARAFDYSGSLGLSAPTQLSITVWANLATPSGTPDVITLRESGSATYTGIYWTDSTHIRLYVQDSGGYSESSAISASTGVWLPYAIVLDATSVKLYINSVVVATLTRSGAMGNLTVLRLGGDNSGLSGGTYDDLRVFSTALDSATVGYVSTVPVTSGGLTATPSDALGMTDSVSIQSSLARTVADPLGITDSVSTVLTMQRALADGLGMTDSVATVVSAARPISDNLGMTDTVDIQITTSGSVDLDEDLGITDSVAVQISANRDLSDGLGITDSMEIVSDFDREMDDNLGLSDAVTVESSLSRDIADAMGLTDDVEVLIIQSGIHAYVWDGTNETEGALSYWDGTQELPVSIEIQG